MNNMNEEIPQAEKSNLEFAIHRIYVKDLSFEAPNAPYVFQMKDGVPEVDFDIQTGSKLLEKELYEVVLAATITVNLNKKVACLIEVKQAGIFTIKSFPQDKMRYILGSVCPGILYPYLRSVVSEAVMHGSFPQLNLAPINFDALYAKYEKEGAKGEVMTTKGEAEISPSDLQGGAGDTGIQ
jgi:preprotein translocase subunit SecB